MNRRQLLVLWIGIGVFVALSLVPPWTVNNHNQHIDAGYGSLFNPPNLVADARADVSLDRLLVQWAIVGALTFAAVLTAGRPVAQPPTSLP